MNNQELISKVHSAMYAQCRKRGYALRVGCADGSRGAAQAEI